jgi:hypothetical protein
VAGALIGIAVALILQFTPLRSLIARVAVACSGLWERILGVTPVRPQA